MALESSGCFGESVLTGRRRQATHVAAAWCETLVLTKDDLIVLFEKNPRAGKRIVRTLLAEVDRKEKLQQGVQRFDEAQGKGFICWRFIDEFRSKEG